MLWPNVPKMVAFRFGAGYFSGMKAPLVICYARYSTPDQAHGDSERRQTRMADAWEKRKGLKIDASLRYWDKGILAFRGKNQKEGELFHLLEFVKSGKVPPGSYLLVENLDRLSRQDPMVSITLLNELLSSGLRVVSLTDGVEYDSKHRGLDAFMSLIRAGIDFYRGHGESERKSGAISKSWESKREDAAKKPMTKKCPSWLVPTETGFKLNQERVRIVRRIFKEFAAGKGVFSICEGLKRDGIAPWGSAKSKDKSKGKSEPKRKAIWHKTYIRKILTSRTVIGEMQPHKTDKTVPGGRARVGAPIEGYYPCAITPVLWAKAQKRWRAIGGGQPAPRGPRGDENGIPSLFSGLLTCGWTGGPVAFQRKGKTKKGEAVRLYCVKKPGEYLGWSYDEFETSVLGAILTTESATIWPAHQASNEEGELSDKIAELELLAAEKNTEVDRILDAIERMPTDSPGAERTRKRLDQRIEEQAELERELAAAKARLDQVQQMAGETDDAVKAVRNLFGHRREPEIRLLLRSHVRQLVAEVKVYFRPVLNETDAAVMAMAYKARKLLRLARVRRAERGESMEGFKFRNDDKKLMDAIYQARIIKASQWAVVRFKSGVEISTKGLAPGLRLAEEPGITMAEGDGEQMKGYLDLFIDPKRGFVKGEVPLVDTDMKVQKVSPEMVEKIFGKQDKPSTGGGLQILTPKSSVPFGGRL